MTKQPVTSTSKKSLETDLKTARQHVADLEGYTETLTDQRDEAQALLPDLRAQVRAGKATVEELIQAETRANSLSSQLGQHMQEIEDAHKAVLTLSEALDTTNDELRLADLLKAREASLKRRDELEAEFVHTLRTQFRGLIENAQVVYAQAAEIVDLDKRKNPHSNVIPHAQGDTYYMYPDRAVGARFSQYAVTSDGFKSLMQGGGPELLLKEVLREMEDTGD
ncbi:MAG: hypothetical protein Q4C89_05500 [Deinococcus sp.]|uniref:hypothetical protein n=1 Tax=Deinococcus sp. TaxID=47478 RepID=UPI0026DB34D1|nr:hypothetical protein [Deinococcus sp.]MDO4245457.1 hypothetical protein [Deinococcus sp.]